MPADSHAPVAPRLYQRAAEVLADEIASGVLPGGSALTQPGIALRFGISRAPARQALALLEARGLVARGASGRYRICGTGPATAPTPPTQPLVARSGSAMLYPEVELAVVARSALADWRLNEAALAQHHRISRTVAREIVARLHQRGIIRKDASSRWTVPMLNAGSLHELYELRWLLEPVALEKAAPRLPPGLLDQMAAELRAAMAPGACAMARCWTGWSSACMSSFWAIADMRC